MKHFFLSLFFLFFYQDSTSPISIAVDRNSIKKDMLLLRVRCEKKTTIIICIEGKEFQRKQVEGEKYYEISNKYDLIQTFDGKNENEAYINLTNKKGVMEPELFKGLKEKEKIYL